MSCTQCGSNNPCSCSQSRSCVTSCSCGNPNCCGTCGCNTSLPATPIPFYACAPSCPENHKQTIVTQNFYYDIAAQNTWNIPGCGETAVLYVPGIKSIAVGAYIWSSGFGYYEVTSFDSTTNQVTVTNNCQDGNATPGTNVPACTKFTVSDPPADNSGTTDSCVAIDFTAPADGVCIPITLTNLDSIQASDLIQIGDGRYTVQSIDGPDVITICNDGLGLIAGTAVIAKDASGNYQYCISVTSTCCDQITEAFGGALTPCSFFENKTLVINEASVAEPGPTSVNSVNTVFDSNSLLIITENTSTCREMKVSFSVQADLQTLSRGTTGVSIVDFELLESEDGNPYTVVYSGQDGWTVLFVPESKFQRNFTVGITKTIPAAATLTLNYIFRVTMTTSGDGEILLINLQIKGAGIGVAV